MVGDGVQYPLQPRLDITQAYDGAGAAAKRVQIARTPGLSDEFGNPGPPYADTQTTYYIKSSVLSGATVAEIGLGDTIYIYADGQRIARDDGSVTFEHHNPATGSWVTSHGHSTYRTAVRQERDPANAETPLSDPYAYAQSYVDLNFGRALFIDGGDPFDYVSGYTRDGLPMTRSELERITGKLGPTRFLMLADVYRIPKNAYLSGEWQSNQSAYHVGVIGVLLPQGSRSQGKNNRANPRNSQRLPENLEEKVANVVNNPKTDCADFIKKLIGNLKGEAFSDNPMDLFKRVEKEKGFRLGETGKYAGLSDMPNGKRLVTIRPVDSTADPKLSEHQAYAYAVTALNELMHHAKKSGMYLDRELAVAIFPLLSPELKAANPLPQTSDVYTNSVYFHSLFKLHCRSLTGE